MKKMTKKAVTSTTTVKVEDKKAAKKNVKQTTVAKESTPIHIAQTDPEWDDYIVGLKKNVEDAVEEGLFNWYLAYVGFIDDKEQGFIDLFDGDKMFRILTSNGYCPTCACNYIEEFKNEKNENGKNKHFVIISKENQDFWMMEEEYDCRKQQSEVKHLK